LCKISNPAPKVKRGYSHFFGASFFGA